VCIKPKTKQTKTNRKTNKTRKYCIFFLIIISKANLE